MKIYGAVIQRDDIVAIVAAMRQAPFKAADLKPLAKRLIYARELSLKDLYTKDDVVYRLVDRLIQREAKKGTIVPGPKRSWAWRS